MTFFPHRGCWHRRCSISHREQPLRGGKKDEAVHGRDERGVASGYPWARALGEERQPLALPCRADPPLRLGLPPPQAGAGPADGAIAPRLDSAPSSPTKITTGRPRVRQGAPWGLWGGFGRLRQEYPVVDPLDHRLSRRPGGQGAVLARREPDVLNRRLGRLRRRLDLGPRHPALLALDPPLALGLLLGLPRLFLAAPISPVHRRSWGH